MAEDSVTPGTQDIDVNHPAVQAAIAKAVEAAVSATMAVQPDADPQVKPPPPVVFDSTDRLLMWGR